MLTEICAYLTKNPGSKAADIARNLDANKSTVNSVLYSNSDVFRKGDGLQWFVQPSELLIDLGDEWLSGRAFERKLQRYSSPLDCEYKRIVFVVADAKLLLEAQARLLALCNQLIDAHKAVVLDFKKASNSTLTFLDRNGFFELLSPEIEVLPKRPTEGRSQTFRGKSGNVIELHQINPNAPTRTVTDLLHKSFIECAGADYDTAALTIIGELYSNVIEHSGTSSHGFAGLQLYKGTGKHVQVVISDNGIGITGTLGPSLKSKHPNLARKIARSGENFGVALLKEVFCRGSISQKDEEGRGLGLKRSGELGMKFSATITVRQSDFEIKIYHTRKGVKFGQWLNLVRIEGTHICFDFMLDSSNNTSLN